MAIAGEFERLGDHGVDVVEVGDGDGKEVFGVGDLAGDAGLFRLEKVEADGVGVVGLEELAAFGGELTDSASLQLGVSFGGGAGSGELCADFDLGGGDDVAVELDGRVVALDGGLDGEVRFIFAPEISHSSLATMASGLGNGGVPLIDLSWTGTALQAALASVP